MDKLKLVFVGGWGHGSRVVNLFKNGQLKNAELVGLGQTDPQEGNYELPGEYDQVPRFDDYREMLDRVDADVAVVSTQLKNLHQAIMDSAAAGCHVIAEKPVAAKVEQLRNLHNTVTQNEVELLLLLDNRAHPYLKAVKQAIDQDVIGDVVMVNARKSYPWNRSRVDDYPHKYGGTIGWVGIHALDFINAVTGLTFRQAVAMESNQLSPEYSSCPDNCGLVFKLSNGGQATVSLDYHRPEASPTHGDDWLRVVGTEGIIKSNLSKNKISCCTDQQADQKLEVPERENYFSNYFDYLLGKGFEKTFSGMTATSFHLSLAAIRAQQSVFEKEVLAIDENFPG
ncbi:MAG: Gfo/Idh/MocA family protein [Bacillota bacterium]